MFVKRFVVVLVAVSVMMVVSSWGYACSAPWYKAAYQYRIPVVIESKETGWQVVPISEEEIYSAINRLEELVYNDEVTFDYNHFEAVAVDENGNTVDSKIEAGFYMVPAGPELASLAEWKEKKGLKIETEKDTHYIVRYKAAGGISPVSGYLQHYPLDYERRGNKYRASYEQHKLLPKTLTEQQRLLLADGSPMKIGFSRVKGLEELSVRKVKIEFLANVKKPGRQLLMLYFQPNNGHHLTIPEKSRANVPENTAKVVRKGMAEKYEGKTRYRVGSNDFFTAWFAETTIKFTPNTPPPDSSSSSIRISSAKNEAQSFQIVLQPKKSFSFRGVTATVLKMKGGKIPAENVEFHAVEYVPIKRSSPVTPVMFRGMIGDALLKPASKIIAKMEGNFVLWGTVQTPADASAGEYKGTVIIRTKEAGKIEISLALEVYDFALPEFSTFYSSMGGSQLTRCNVGIDRRNVADYHHAQTKDEIKKLARNYYDFMAKHKFTPHNVIQYSEIGMKWLPPPEGYNVDKPGNYFKLYDWDFTELNKNLKHYIDDLKVNNFTLVHSNPSVIQMFKHLPGADLKEYERRPPHITLAWQVFREATFVGINKTEKDQYIEITEDQYDHLILDFYRTIAENLDKHGWLDYAYILIDETHRRGFGEFLHFLRLMKSNPLTARIRITWTIQAPLAYTHKEDKDADTYAFNGLIDVYIPDWRENYNCWSPYMFTDYGITPERDKLWTYNTHTSRSSIDSPGINNRATAMHVFDENGNGFLRWSAFDWDRYMTEGDNPWVDPWCGVGNGHLSYFYPPSREGLAKEFDPKITPSLRIMSNREGVDDFEYAMLLEELVEKCRGKGINTSRGEILLNHIDGFFYNSVQWSQNDAWYLDLRELIAREITALKKNVE